MQSFSIGFLTTTANYKLNVHTCPYLHWPGEGELSTLSFSQCGSPYYPSFLTSAYHTTKQGYTLFILKTFLNIYIALQLANSFWTSLGVQINLNNTTVILFVLTTSLVNDKSHSVSHKSHVHTSCRMFHSIVETT